MLCRKPCGWQHNLNQKVSGKTGVVQFAFATVRGAVSLAAGERVQFYL